MSTLPDIGAQLRSELGLFTPAAGTWAALAQSFHKDPALSTYTGQGQAMPTQPDASRDRTNAFSAPGPSGTYTLGHPPTQALLCTQRLCAKTSLRPVAGSTPLGQHLPTQILGQRQQARLLRHYWLPSANPAPRGSRHCSATFSCLPLPRPASCNTPLLPPQPAWPGQGSSDSSSVFLYLDNAHNCLLIKRLFA